MSSFISFGIASWRGVVSLGECLLSVAMVFEAWRTTPFIGNGKVLWRLISFAILWSVGKERNARIFRRSSMPKDDVAKLVLVRLARWASSKE